MAPFSLLEHTADIGIAASGRDPAELFIAAAEGMCSLLAAAPGGSRQSRTVSIRAADRELLLVFWLQEILYLFSSEYFLPCDYELTRLTEHELTATLRGGVVDPRRQPPQREIKAVTLHRLSVIQGGDGWRATVYFDL